MSWLDVQLRLNRYGYGLATDGIPGPRTYSALFAFMGARANAPILGNGAAQQFGAYRITIPLRLSHWLAQFGVESANFSVFEENLDYSAARLMQVWPSRFPDIATASICAHNPEMLANKVYGGRMGNDAPGDGWKYRGRGPGLTGKANYAAAQSRTGLPLVDQPDLASQPANFVLLASDYWAAHGCNDLADRDDLRAVTLAINGGYNGIADRAKLLTKTEGLLS